MAGVELKGILMSDFTQPFIYPCLPHFPVATPTIHMRSTQNNVQECQKISDFRPDFNFNNTVRIITK